jgi:hypothetical protein
VEYENETRKNLYNLFACVAHVHASIIYFFIVIVDNREISAKKGGAAEREKLVIALHSLNNHHANPFHIPRT